MFVNVCPPNNNFLSLGFIKFKVLMEHLDPDEEDEEGEASASANIRNKAINALLGGSAPLSGPSPRNQAGPETDDDYSDGDERTPGVSEILKYVRHQCSLSMTGVTYVVPVSPGSHQGFTIITIFFPVRAVLTKGKANRRLL